MFVSVVRQSIDWGIFVCVLRAVRLSSSQILIWSYLRIESLFPVRDTFRCPNRPLAQLRAVEAAFPLEKTQKVSGKKRKIFWSEIDLSSSNKEAQQLDEESADNEKNIGIACESDSSSCFVSEDHLDLRCRLAVSAFQLIHADCDINRRARSAAPAR